MLPPNLFPFHYLLDNVFDEPQITVFSSILPVSRCLRERVLFRLKTIKKYLTFRAKSGLNYKSVLDIFLELAPGP